VNLILPILLFHLPECLINLSLSIAAVADATGTDIFLRLFDEIEVGAFHDDLAVGVPINEHLVCVGLVSRLDCLDALPKISLLLLMEAVLVILVAKVVNNRLPLLNQV